MEVAVCQTQALYKVVLTSHFSDDVCHAMLSLLCFYKLSVFLDESILVLIFVTIHPVIGIRLIYIVLNSEVVFIEAYRFELIASFERTCQQIKYIVLQLGLVQV